MESGNNEPKYYKIKKEYLLKIFTEEQIEKSKFERRHFIGYENKLVMLFIPEQTNHGNPNKFHLCYYFNFKDLGEQRYIDIPGLLFVPFSERIFDRKFSERQNNKRKLNDIKSHFSAIQWRVYRCLELSTVDQRFKNKHIQITKSKEAYEEYRLKHEKEKEMKKLTQDERTM